MNISYTKKGDYLLPDLILKIKYNLIIVKDNPMILKKYY